MQKMNVIVRFAPSPTGHLHIGGARVAIFNWLFARHHDGKYLVRIEDTDILRSKKEYSESISNSLKWLGLMPDEPALYQSSKIEDHKKVAGFFLENRLAYPCFCENVTEKKLDNPEATFKYDGSCRDKKWSEEDLKRPHALRFRLPKKDGAISFDDKVRGKISFSYDRLDDFVIVRRDGTPTYNFVVVLDDISMNISHVIRGEDHISNTPKQIMIYQALGKHVPVYAHLPLILGGDGKRLSKREAATSVLGYCMQGFLPRALFNYLVSLGWAHGDQEVFTTDEMIKHFSLEKVGKKGAIFDFDKLKWLNGVYMRQASFEELMASLEFVGEDNLKRMKNSWSEVSLKELVSLYKERSSTLIEMSDVIMLFAQDPKNLDIGLIAKWLIPNSSKLLGQFIEKLHQIEQFDHDSLLALAKEESNSFEAKLVNLAQPLRLALTGKVQSPGVFELMAILGKEKSIKRIKFLQEKLLNY